MDGKKYRKLQGTYLVIFISFADVKQTNYADAVQKIKNKLKVITTTSEAYADCISRCEKPNGRAFYNSYTIVTTNITEACPSVEAHAYSDSTWTTVTDQADRKRVIINGDLREGFLDHGCPCMLFFRT